jgi:hypothetical protein
MRLLGAISGYIHAMVAIKTMIGSEVAYSPIPTRHTRKQRERDLRLEIPRALYARLERDLRSAQAAYANQAALKQEER